MGVSERRFTDDRIIPDFRGSWARAGPMVEPSVARPSDTAIGKGAALASLPPRPTRRTRRSGPVREGGAHRPRTRVERVWAGNSAVMRAAAQLLPRATAMQRRRNCGRDGGSTAALLSWCDRSEALRTGRRRWTRSELRRGFRKLTRPSRIDASPDRSTANAVPFRARGRQQTATWRSMGPPAGDRIRVSGTWKLVIALATNSTPSKGVSAPLHSSSAARATPHRIGDN
jgi:hypothetical protein